MFNVGAVINTVGTGIVKGGAKVGSTVVKAVTSEAGKKLTIAAGVGVVTEGATRVARTVFDKVDSVMPEVKISVKKKEKKAKPMGDR